MFEILIVNPMLWLNILIPIIVAAIIFFWKKEYNIKEFAIQSGITFVIIFIFYMIAFGTTTNLYHKVFYNTYIKDITKYEEWTERVEYTERICSGSGKNETCRNVDKVRYDYHPEYYQLTNYLGNTKNVSKQEYLNAVKQYGKVFKSLHHFNQSSFGDGNAYVSTFKEIIPFVEEHTEINYLKAVKYNVLKSNSLPEKVKQYERKGQLISYPEIYNGIYGNNIINRIIKTKEVNINTIEMNKNLSNYASIYGQTKQVNPLIYIVKNQNRDFKEVLRTYWSEGSKNDSILILSIDEKGIILWSDTVAWTKNSDFLINNSKIYNGLNINNPKVIELYKEQINKNFKRISMKEYSYLKNNIDISFTAEIIILLLNLFASSFAFYWFIKNDPFYIDKLKGFK